MALDKAIDSGKEHRKPYYGSKRFDRTCRNHGSCGHCSENRKHKYTKRLQDTIDQLEQLKWEPTDESDL